MARNAARALAWCLEVIEAGDLSPQECLARFPDLRSELEPMLHLALELRNLPGPSASAHLLQQGRRRLVSRLRSEPEPPAGTPARFSPRSRMRPRSLARTLVAVLLVLVGLAGAGLVYASQGALPGQPLYALKSRIERARLALAPQAGDRVLLHANYAERRVDEMEMLVEAGRFEDIAAATQAFDGHISDATRLLAQMVAAESTEAPSLAMALQAQLDLSAYRLEELRAIVTPGVQQHLERSLAALRNQQARVSAWLPGEADTLEATPAPVTAAAEQPCWNETGPPPSGMRPCTAAATPQPAEAGMQCWPEQELGPAPDGVPVCAEPGATTRAPAIQPSPTSGSFDLMGPSATPTAGTGQSLHIGDLDGFAISTGSSTWQAEFTVTVHTQNHAPLAKAIVSALASGGWFETELHNACITDSTGQCHIVVEDLPASADWVSLIVLSVAHPDLSFAASQSHDPDGDSDGSVLIIYRP